MQGQNVEALFESLKSLGLPEGDFAVFGSGPLIVRGIIPAANDLDIICRGAAWEKVESIGKLEHSDEYGVEIVTLHDGQLSFGTKWGIGNFDIDELINGAESIDGLPFVQLQHVISYKLKRANPKDLSHIEALKKSDVADNKIDWAIPDPE